MVGSARANAVRLQGGVAKIFWTAEDDSAAGRVTVQPVAMRKTILFPKQKRRRMVGNPATG